MCNARHSSDPLCIVPQNFISVLIFNHIMINREDSSNIDEDLSNAKRPVPKHGLKHDYLQSKFDELLVDDDLISNCGDLIEKYDALLQRDDFSEKHCDGLNCELINDLDDFSIELFDMINDIDEFTNELDDMINGELFQEIEDFHAITASQSMDEPIKDANDPYGSFIIPCEEHSVALPEELLRRARLRILSMLPAYVRRSEYISPRSVGAEKFC